MSRPLSLTRKQTLMKIMIFKHKLLNLYNNFHYKIFWTYYNVRGMSHGTSHEGLAIFANTILKIYFWSPNHNSISKSACTCIIHAVGIKSLSIRFTMLTNDARVPAVWSLRQRLATPGLIIWWVGYENTLEYPQSYFLLHWSTLRAHEDEQWNGFYVIYLLPPPWWY